MIDPAVIAGLFTIVGALLGYNLALSRHKFERIYDRKLNYLADLYKEAVNLEFLLRKYVSFTGADQSNESREKKRVELVGIEKKLHEFQFMFWENEIILDNEIVEAINRFITKYVEAFSKLLTSAVAHKQDQHKVAFEYWDRSYDLVFTDLRNIKNSLTQSFKKVTRYSIWPFAQ